MREIKYRAWDLVTKKMRKVEDIHFNKDGEIEFFDIVPERRLRRLNEISLRFSEQVVLMQYTGLKDKDGAEIYEGDILNLEKHNPFYVYYDEETAMYRVESCATNFSDSLFVFMKTHSRFCSEIIGNIYENPELLEKNNGN